MISGQDARCPHSQHGCATNVNEYRLVAGKDCGYRFEVLNYIWLALVLLAVAIGGWNDRWKEVTDGAFDGAKTAVTIAFGLIGVMALWLGVMRLAERAGLVKNLRAHYGQSCGDCFPTCQRSIQRWVRC